MPPPPVEEIKFFESLIIKELEDLNSYNQVMKLLCRVEYFSTEYKRILSEVQIMLARMQGRIIFALLF